MGNTAGIPDPLVLAGPRLQMDRPRLLIACVLAVAFVALLGFAAADDRFSVGESVLEEAQNPNNSAMMAKLEAEAANLKKVLARQQAEKQAIAQSQQPSDKTSPAQVDSTPAVARDSKSTEPLKQHPQDTLSVRPVDTPAADTQGGATVVDSGSPSVEDTVPVSRVPAQVDSTNRPVRVHGKQGRCPRQRGYRYPPRLLPPVCRQLVCQ